MKKILFITTVITVMLAVSSIAAPGRILKAAKALELTDDQIEQIKDAGYKNKKSMILLKSKLDGLKLDLKYSMGKLEVDERKLLDLQERISAQKAAIAESRLKHQLEVRKMLNDEQLKKWLKMKQKSRPGNRFDRGKFPHREGFKGMRGFDRHPDGDMKAPKAFKWFEETEKSR